MLAGAGHDCVDFEGDPDTISTILTLNDEPEPGVNSSNPDLRCFVGRPSAEAKRGLVRVAGERLRNHL